MSDYDLESLRRTLASCACGEPSEVAGKCRRCYNRQYRARNKSASRPARASSVARMSAAEIKAFQDRMRHKESPGSVQMAARATPRKKLAYGVAARQAGNDVDVRYDESQECWLATVTCGAVIIPMLNIDRDDEARARSFATVLATRARLRTNITVDSEAPAPLVDRVRDLIRFEIGSEAVDALAVVASELLALEEAQARMPHTRCPHCDGPMGDETSDWIAGKCMRAHEAPMGAYCIKTKCPSCFGPSDPQICPHGC